MPSAFYAGQDQEMLTKNYMPTPDRRTAELIADCFTQFECLVCEYWRQESRKWQTRIKWFRVPGKIATSQINIEDDGRGPGREKEPSAAQAKPRRQPPWHAAFSRTIQGDETGDEHTGNAVEAR